MEEANAKKLSEKMIAHKFKKGNTPWNKGKKMPKKEDCEKPATEEKNQKSVIDENTVKIHIVKERKPLPPKDFSGKLEDEKERTAIRFIRSVAARKPLSIEIDGLKYYSIDVLKKAYEENLKKQKELDEDSELMEKATNTLKEAHENLVAVCKSKSLWKAIAFGLMVGYVAMLAIQIFFSK